jgi:hypothetical protein
LKTLEQRLQSVARRMVPKQQPHSVASSAPLGNMIATPGAASNMMPTPGNGSSMMPTPGGVSAMMPTPGSTGNLMQSGVGGGGLSNMIPTPGNGNNLMTSMTHGTGTGNGSNLLNSMTHGAGTMMPTPGTLGHTNNIFGMAGSNMMPTPGGSGSNYSLVSQQAMGGIRIAQNGHVPSSMGMSVGSQMIPTPGLNSSQGLGITPASSAGLGGLANGSPVAGPQLQQFGGGATNHIYGGINGQLGGGLPSSGQQQRKTGSAIGVVNGAMSNGMMLGNGQHLMNGAANLHTPPAYLNASQYSSLQLQQQQQRITQQQQQQLHHQQQQQQQQQHRPQQLRIQRMCTFLLSLF